MNSRFFKDLSQMVAEGVITNKVEGDIRGWYQQRKVDKPNRLLIVLGVLGALLVGLGIILILAHNWDNFPRIIKTVLAFLPLLVSQSLVIYSIIKKNEVWVESSATLLFFSVGTAISLISQIYHIPGNINNFLVTWIILTMPLIYLLRSKALALLHLVFSTWWVLSSGYGYRSEIPWFYLLFFAWVLPFYRNLFNKQPESNMLTVLNWVLPISFAIALGAFIDDSESLGFLMFMFMFGICHQWGTSKDLKKITTVRNGFRLLGLLGMIVLLLITSFKDVWEEIVTERIDFGIELYMILALFSLNAFLFYKNIHDRVALKFSHLLPLIFFVVFLAGTLNIVLAAIFTNIIVLLLGVLFIRAGAREINFKKLNLGLLVVTVLIACRFFDTELSFVFRGIVFVGVGLGFFLTNYLIMRKTSKKELN